MQQHYDRIFLLSHMRAYTSLLGHILGTHPAINGYFEMHISYQDESSLDQQLETYRQFEPLKPGSRYLFDKILHNTYQLRVQRLGSANIRILVSLAEPERSIKSIVDLFTQKPSEEPLASPRYAADYYIDRLRYLADFCQSHRGMYNYYDAEQARRSPEVLLPRLSHWLGLSSPLRERYRIFSQTGKARKGDSSELIRSGRIDRVIRDYSHVQVPGRILHEAQQVYHDCREAIIGHSMDKVTQ